MASDRRVVWRRLRPRVPEVGRADYRLTYRTTPRSRGGRKRGCAFSPPACNAGGSGQGPSRDGSEFVVTVVVVIVLITATALVTSRRGRTGLRQRLQALASRLGADAPQKDARLRGSAHPVGTRNRPAQPKPSQRRAPRPSDSAGRSIPFPGGVVTDERGETVFRNSKGVRAHRGAATGTSRAQAVEEPPRRNGARRSRETGLELTGHPGLRGRAESIDNGQRCPRGDRGSSKTCPNVAASKMSARLRGECQSD